MTFSALIISHGQPSDPEAGEAEIEALSQEVALHLPEATIVGVSLAAKGRLEALSAMHPGAFIYPMFMAEGWFTRSQIPKRTNAAAGPQMMCFGVDCLLPALAARWLARTCENQRWTTEDTTVVIAGHGSGKSRRVSEGTRAFARQITDQLPTRAMRVGFVEEDPSLTEVLTDTGPQSICLPFFAARRGHVLEDLPEAAQEASFEGVMLDPIGLHPDVPKLIADALRWRAVTPDVTKCVFD